MTAAQSPALAAPTIHDKPVVLFVDDDESMLSSLQTTLRRLRNSYNFLFADGVTAALELVARESVDIVVTDMRMPGLTGADLLWTLNRDYPQVVRYVLSGEADRELVMRALPVTHRWLSKPCDRDDLADALADAARYHGLLCDPAVRAAVGGAESLPSPPKLYIEMMALLSNDETSAADVAVLAETDAALSAKLLQWANSAFSGGRQVPDVHGAVVRIGMTAVSQLVLSEGAMRILGPADAIPGLSDNVLADHTKAVSNLAARFTPGDAGTTARVGGMLSNVGLLLEATRLGERLATAYERAEETGVSLVDAERELFGVGHPELAGYLLSIWGLPTDVVLAVVGSHDHPAADLSAPMPARDAVRVGRLVAQRQSHAQHMGAPHLDRLDPLLEAAVDRWSEAESEENRNGEGAFT